MRRLLKQINHELILPLFAAVLALVLVATVVVPYSITGASAQPGLVSISIGVNQQPQYQFESKGYYYLSQYTGNGSGNNPFRPIAGIGEWAAIDLRPNPTKLYGYALVVSPILVTAPGVITIVNNLNNTIPSNILNAVKTTIGTGTSDITTTNLSDFVAQLLIGAQRSNLCPPLNPEIDGKYRIYLGGQIYGDPPPVLRPGTIHDTFNRANAETLGTSSDGTWAWVDPHSDWDLVSNQAKCAYGEWAAWAVANSDLGDADHYAQVEITTGQYAGVETRCPNTSTQTYYWFYVYSTGSVVGLQKVVAGSYTAIGSTYAVTYGAGKILKGTSDGSSQTVTYDGVDKNTYTDTSIASGNYTGIFSSITADTLDNFEAGTLGVVISVSSSPTSRAFSFVKESSTYWSNNLTLGYSPSWNITDAQCYFTLTNDGTTTENIAVHSHNYTNPNGSVGWTLVSTTPSSAQARMTMYRTSDNSSLGIVLHGADQTFRNGLAQGGTVKWEIKLETGTFTDGLQKSDNITFTASQG